MTNRRNTRPLATVLLVTAAVAVSALTGAAPASAKYKTNFEGFAACVSTARAHGSSAQAAAFDCCVLYDGVWQGVYPKGYCAWPAGNMDHEPGSVSSPGSVIVVVPPSDTRSGRE